MSVSYFTRHLLFAFVLVAETQTSRIRIRATVGGPNDKPIEYTPLPIDTEVSYWSVTNDRWIDAVVEDYANGAYVLNKKSKADPAKVRLPDETIVEYWSKSRGGWIKAEVLDFDHEANRYELDVHPSADPIKVRLPSEAPPAEIIDYAAQYTPPKKDKSLQNEADALEVASPSDSEVGRCSHYESTTETCRTGSRLSNWVTISDESDRSHCAQKCRTLAVRTQREICCTLDSDGACWGMYNNGGVREKKNDDDPHVGATLVCGPPISSAGNLTSSRAKWADVEDDSFLSNDLMVRAGEFLEDMFVNIAPVDLRQGSLGDCWLIASIASFAIYPAAVRRIFLQQFENDEGEYGLQLWHPEHTQWVRLTVDDLVPAKKGRKEDQPKYIKASDAGGFWPLLLEKAFAKMLGGYDELRGKGGFTAVAYAALSGASPNYMYAWSDSKGKWKKYDCTGLGDKRFDGYVLSSNTWQLVSEAYEANNLLSGSCCKKGSLEVGNGDNGFSGEEMKSNGLFDNHAYSILTVKEFKPGRRVRYCVNEDTGKVVNDVMCRGAGIGFFEERKKKITSIDSPLRLVQVRNPWGNAKKFTGKWSYADQSTWSEHSDIKSVLDYRDEDDGTWWMTFEELERTFRKIYIGTQDMVAFDPPPPECNIGYGASEFDGVGIKWKERITASQCGFCKWSDSSGSCDGEATVRSGEKLCCRLINAKLRGTARI